MMTRLGVAALAYLLSACAAAAQTSPAFTSVPTPSQLNSAFSKKQDFNTWTLQTRPRAPNSGMLGYNASLQAWEWWNPGSNSWLNPATVNPTGDITNSTVIPGFGQKTFTGQLLGTLLPKTGDISQTSVIVDGVSYSTPEFLALGPTGDASNATATATGGATKSLADWFLELTNALPTTGDASNATRTPTGANTVSDTLANAASYQIDARNFGAKFDGVYAPTGAQITAGLTSLNCTSCTFTSTAIDGGKIVYLQNANTNGGWWKSTIASITDSHHAILSSPAPNKMISSTGASATVTAGGSGYHLYDTIVVAGGIPSGTVGSGGSGGVSGSAVYTLAGGTCSVQPTFNVTVSGGAITSINTIASSGTCTVFPSGTGLSLTYASGTGSGVTSATGNFTSATQLIVAALKVTAATITGAGGSGTGTCTFTGTTGDGGHQTQKFTGTVTMTSGAISSVSGTVSNGGIYIISPPDVTAAAVTFTGTGCPASGTAAVSMGPQQVAINPGNPGSYFTSPTGTLSQASTSGAGTGATFTMTVSNAQAMYYGTDNGTPIQNAINYCANTITTATAGFVGGCSILVPNGIGLTSQGWTINQSFISLNSQSPNPGFVTRATAAISAQGVGSEVLYANNTPPSTGYMLKVAPSGTLRLAGNSFQGIELNCNGAPGCSGLLVQSINGGDWTFAVNQPFPTAYSVTGSTAVSATSISGATITAGGSGGTNGSLMLYQVAGGTCTVQPQLYVVVAGGAVTSTVSVANPGVCSANPGASASITLVGVGTTASGATATVSTGGGSTITLASTTGISLGQAIEADGLISGTQVQFIPDSTHIVANTQAEAPLSSGMTIYIGGVGFRADSLSGVGLSNDTQNMRIHEAQFTNTLGFGPGMLVGSTATGPTIGNFSLNFIGVISCNMLFGDCLDMNDSDHDTFDQINATAIGTNTGRAVSLNGSVTGLNYGGSRFHKFNIILGETKFRGTDEGGMTTPTFSDLITFQGSTASQNKVLTGTSAGACVTTDRGQTTCTINQTQPWTSNVMLDYSGATFPSPTTAGAPIAAPLMTPSSSSAACAAGSMKWDASFIYVCTATNTWKRATLSTF